MPTNDHSFLRLLPGFVISAGTEVVLKVALAMGLLTLGGLSIAGGTAAQSTAAQRGADNRRSQPTARKTFPARRPGHAER